MEALGLDVKGLWLVDFDSGSGVLLLALARGAPRFYHGYDEGFAGRARIQ